MSKQKGATAYTKEAGTASRVPPTPRETVVLLKGDPRSACGQDGITHKIKQHNKPPRQFSNGWSSRYFRTA